MTTRILRYSSMIIALTGFMGCGKSSVGRELSTLLGIPVIDLDKYIEQSAGKRIPDIFAESGESCFRKLETFCLSEVLFAQTNLPSSSCSEDGTVSEDTSPEQSFILSLGGGTIVRPENVEMIRERCRVFFLRATVETLRLHLGGEQSQRPLLRSGGFEALLQERAPLYAAAADYIIDTDNLSPMQIAGIIANLVT